MSLKKQKGSALITAILITAITAMLAMALALEQRTLIHSTQLIINADQGYLDLQGIQYAAIASITDYQKQITEQKIPVLPSAIIPAFQFNNATLSGTLQDAQGFFNLNTLHDPNQQWRFIRLLQTIAPNVTQNQGAALAQAISNWLNVMPTNDDAYLNYDPPYRAAHLPMVDASELRAIQGVSPELITALKPYIIAIPSASNTWSTNINSATMPVLSTLSPNIDLEQATAISECIKAQGFFASLADFTEDCLTPNKVTSLDNATLTTQYFVVKALAKIGAQHITLTSLITTSNDNTVPNNVTIVWQKLD